MTLPQSDIACLEGRGLKHTVSSEGNMTCVILADYPLPPGYNQAKATLLLRLSPGFPDVAPDMWWFDPPVRLADGRQVQATEVTEQYLGRGWQRWSRHFGPGQWQSGIDSLESFMALLRRELQRCASA